MPQPQATREPYIEWLRRSVVQRSSLSELSEARLAHAWQVARRAAQLLKERYDVSRVRVFGSLLHQRRFHDSSDIDLAVEGLAVSDYWDAVADLLFLDDEITIDLIDPDTCPSDIWTRIEREGVEI